MNIDGKVNEKGDSAGSLSMHRKEPKMGTQAYWFDPGNSCPPSQRMKTSGEVLKQKQPKMGYRSDCSDYDLWKIPPKKNLDYDMKPVVEACSATKNKMSSDLLSRGRRSMSVAPPGKKLQENTQDVVETHSRAKGTFAKTTKNLNEFKTETSRRKSLPTTAVSKVRKEFRRMSGKFMSVKEESGDFVYNDEETQCKSPPLPLMKTKQRLILVQNGVLRIADQFDVPMIYVGDEQNVKHLIYGEGYSGINNCEGFPNELISVLAKTPCLETLELRGYWDLENIPSDFNKCIMYFPRLPNLRKLVLPKEGRFLDRMGSILLGIFGLQLESFECSSEFLKGCCVQDLCQLVPNLKHFKVFDTFISDGILDIPLEEPASELD